MNIKELLSELLQFSKEREWFEPIALNVRNIMIATLSKHL